MNKASMEQIELLKLALSENLIAKIEYQESLIDSTVAYRIIGIAKNRALGEKNNINTKHLYKEAFSEVAVYDNNKVDADKLFNSNWRNNLEGINCKDNMPW